MGLRPVAEQNLGVSLLEDAAQIRRSDAYADALHCSDVMADRDVGEVELVTWVDRQIEDLRLCRDVWRGGRLVTDRDLGLHYW